MKLTNEISNVEKTDLQTNRFKTFTEGGGFVSKHLENPLLSTGRSDSLISYNQTK